MWTSGLHLYTGRICYMSCISQHQQPVLICRSQWILSRFLRRANSARTAPQKSPPRSVIQSSVGLMDSKARTLCMSFTFIDQLKVDEQEHENLPCPKNKAIRRTVKINLKEVLQPQPWLEKLTPTKLLFPAVDTFPSSNIHKDHCQKPGCSKCTEMSTFWLQMFAAGQFSSPVIIASSAD